MEQLLLTIGFGNTVVAERVVAILSPNSSPMKRVKDEAKEARSLIDITHGRKTRAIIITDSNHVILSAIQAETVASRFEALMKGGEEKPKEPVKEPAKQGNKKNDTPDKLRNGQIN